MTNAELWTSYKQSPSAEIKKKIVLKYSNLIHYVINKSKLVENNVVEYQDYYQIGVEGLNQAIERFNPDYGTKFETYAIFRIRGKIIDEIRKYNSNSYAIRKNKPSHQVLSLDHKFYGENSTYYPYDVIPSDDISLDELIVNKELKEKLIELIKTLNDRDRKILTLYYFENLKYKEISQILGLTIPRISQLHGKIIKSLKEKLNVVFENN